MCILLKSAYPSWTAHSRGQGQHLFLKNTLKMPLELNCRRGLLNAKMPSSKFFIWHRLQQHVWGALVPQGDIKSKTAQNKMFLEFHFRRGQLNAKMPNLQISNWPPLHTSPWGGGRGLTPQGDLGPKNVQNL